MRLRCEIFRNGKAVPGKVFDVLNEIVVDRGSNPYLSKIECYEHDHLITKVTLLCFGCKNRDFLLKFTTETVLLLVKRIYYISVDIFI